MSACDGTSSRPMMTSRIPGLGIEHVEGIPLILHTEVHQFRVVFPHDAVIQINRVESVIGLEFEIFGHKGEVMQVSGTKNDGIDVFGAAVNKCCGVTFDFLQQGHFLPVLGPLVAHGRGAMRNGDRFTAVFPALRTDVFGGVRGTDDEDVLAGKLHRITEIMGMQYTTFEGIEAGVFGYVGGREVTAGDNYVIEFFGVLDAFFMVFYGNVKHAFMLVVGDLSDGRIEPNPVTYP